MNIVFFGTSEFGAIILEKLVEAGMTPVLVVTTPDKPAGRKQLLTPPPVKSCILKHETWNLKLLQPAELDSRFTLHILSFKPDLFVVAAYGKILPKDILDISRHGALNVHPSLLPKYRGPAPVQKAILNGEKTTGVTIMLMDEEMDHGPILTQQEIPISNDQFPSLHNKLANLGAQLLIETIPLWVEGKTKPVAQDHSKATYMKRIKKEDGRIDWKKDAEYIERQVRALYPWPGTFTLFKDEEGKERVLKICRARVLPYSETSNPGKTFVSDGKLAVETGKDTLLIEELQLEGGKPMSSKEFLLGHHVVIF